MENRGKLPWPVDRGVITSHFGAASAPVLKYVTEKNIDIEITSSGVTPVKVFSGVRLQGFFRSGSKYGCNYKAW
jgi:murein DD-endopeptidase MepM/ murein hydrolase activator NlpD